MAVLLQYLAVFALFLKASLAKASMYNIDVKIMVAQTKLVGGNSRIYGTVSFVQTTPSSPVIVHGTIYGLNSGFHGLHIHELSRKYYPEDRDVCEIVGGHFNPLEMEHGGPGDQVRHIGDLGNVLSKIEDGVLKAEIKLQDNVLSLSGARSIIGYALAVHASVDDLGRGNNPESKLYGNAGPMEACGIIYAENENYS